MRSTDRTVGCVTLPAKNAWALQVAYARAAERKRLREEIARLRREEARRRIDEQMARQDRLNTRRLRRGLQRLTPVG